VTLVNQPGHATLYDLYSKATALIFPSLYEGYGLPVGEAQWLGTPVLASDATSIPEAGGPAPVYFDATSVDEVEALIRRVATDAAWLEALRARTAAARPRLRSWRECALALCAMLDRS
jgi:glycosyltransferase involved in cell wall biosynthesis